METLPRTQLTAEQRFQLFMDCACDYAIFFMDPGGHIIEWSSGAEKIIGFSESEAVGQHTRIIFTQEDRDAGVPEQEMAKAARDGQANDERWHRRKDSSRFFAVGRLVALKNDAEQLFGFAKVVRDATPHKTLEEALRLSDEQFRATFAQAPLGMALTDLDGVIQQANAALCRLTGFDESELCGREAVQLSCPEDRSRISREIQRLFKGEQESFMIEKRLQRADGSRVWVQNSGAVLRDAEGRPISIIDLCQDISSLKRSEAELETRVERRTAALHDKTKQLESFCYTVAHDLRAPLRAIAGYAQFIHLDFGDRLGPEALEYLRRIEASAARLDRLIQDLLTYTRIQQVSLEAEEVDLTDVVREVVKELERDGRADGATITIRTPLGRARGDAATLGHVFLNLISNALKFRHDNVPSNVTIFAEDRESRLRVWVEDNGIGIDPKFADRVFGMFERVHQDRKFPGTGVGLAIVATALERLGGSRGVEPNPAGGSRFWIELPKSGLAA